MQGVVPVWDVRAARARRLATSDPLGGHVRMEHPRGVAIRTESRRDAPERVRSNLDRLVRIVLLNLRRVKPAPAAE